MFDSVNQPGDLDLFRVTAARTSVFNASSSLLSPSRKSMAGLEFAAPFVACSVLSPLEILLQAVHVIDAGTDLREEVCIACTRPPTGQEVSGNKAECECDKGDYSGYSHLFSLLPAPALCECRYRSLTRPLRNRAILVFARRQASTSM